MSDARVRLRNGCDCSEIADDLFRAADGQGNVVVFRAGDTNWTVGNQRPAFNPPFRDSSTLNYPQAGRTGSVIPVEEGYHAVYSDGKYIYDGALHSDGIPVGDYMKLIKSMNSQNVSYRLYNPDQTQLFKGGINGQ